MCCFSAATPVGWIARLISALTPPVHVSATNIFARMVAPGEQVPEGAELVIIAEAR